MPKRPDSVSHRRVSRRQFAQYGALSAALLPGHALAAVQSKNVELHSTFLMDIELDVDTPQSLGSRQIYPITGGTFEGPRLRGTALRGGGDWFIRRPDGAIELDVRVTLQTDDDELIYLTYRGLIFTCRSRIRHQAAAGSWTMPRQWEIQRTWLNLARAAVRSPAKPNGV